MLSAVLWVSCRTTDRQQNIDNSFFFFLRGSLPTCTLKGTCASLRVSERRDHVTHPGGGRSPSANQVSALALRKEQQQTFDVWLKRLECPKQGKGTKEIKRASQSDLSGVKTREKKRTNVPLFSSCYLWSFQLDSLSLSPTNFPFGVTVCQFVVASLACSLRSHLERAALDVHVGRLKTSFCNLRSCVRHLEHREGEEFPLVVVNVGQTRTFESKNKESDPS